MSTTISIDTLRDTLTEKVAALRIDMDTKLESYQPLPYGPDRDDAYIAYIAASAAWCATCEVLDMLEQSS